MKADLLHCLHDVLTPPEVEKDGEPLGGTNDIILFPSDLGSSTAKVDATHNIITNGSIFTFYSRMSLSSLAFDYVKDLPCVENLFRATETWLLDSKNIAATEFKKFYKSDAPDLDVTVWRTLGGPDLVCLAFPKSPAEIAFLNTLLCTIRCLPASELLREISDVKSPKGHAFAAVQANLLYRENENLFETIKSNEFKDEETQFKLSYPCRVTVGPGHEHAVSTRITNAINDNGIETSLCWGHRSIQYRFDHFYNLAIAIRDSSRPFDANKKAQVRQPDVSAFRTTIATDRDSFALFENSYQHGPRGPVLSGELDGLLRSVKAKLSSFGEEYLGRWQSHQLMQLYSTVESALHRSDRASGVRDLLPFFDQLSRAVTEIDWDTVLEDKSHEELSDEFTFLFSHLWGAIRNRIENRGEPLDPSFPNTIEYGASKVVSAYSVTAWIASYLLFHGDDDKIPDTDCARENFATAVCAGAMGVVVGGKFFEDLLERSSTLFESKTREKWNAHLCHLSVSGPVLFTPEVTLVFCLHEIAEFSDWPRKGHFEDLYSEVNDWVFETFSVLVGVELSEHTDYDCESKDDNRLLKEILRLPNAWHSQSVLAAKRREDGPPADYIETLGYRLEAIQKVHAARAFEPQKTDIELNDTHDYPDWCNTLVKDHPGLKKCLVRFCKEISSIFREVFPDFAMCLGLQHLLKCDDESLLDQIDHLFTMLISTSVDSFKPHVSRSVDHIVLRWAVQLSCFLQRQGEEKNTRPFVQMRIKQRAEAISRALEGAGAERFDPETWMREYWDELVFVFGNEKYEKPFARELGRHVPPKIPMWNYEAHPAAYHLIKEFRELWFLSVNAGTEIEMLDRRRFSFIHGLWGKSQKFCVNQLLDRS